MFLGVESSFKAGTEVIDIRFCGVEDMLSKPMLDVDKS